MTYLDALDRELSAAGIPPRRRGRILAEFADHLHEDADAKLGAPRELARQFADELGTRFARAAAFRTFAALALTGIGLGIMFLAVGRMRGLTVQGGTHTPTPSWASPILLVAALAAQVALAAGGLALLRAWRLRREPTISRADATILARRSALGLLAGAVTLAALPTAAVAFAHAAGSTWTTFSWILAGVGLVALAAALPPLLDVVRLRPDVDGRPGDLIDDLGSWVPAGLTPARCALLLSVAIVVVATVAGVLTDDPYDGALRGITDAIACATGFIVLGRYLGLRTSH
jgi:HAAS domain-containing protein